jgi:flagellar biosynthetic protein FlhB
LTEEASPYRLEEFRRKGQVAQSREISGMAALIAAGAAVYILSPKVGTSLAEYMRDVFRADITSHLDFGSSHILSTVMIKALRVMAIGFLPICLFSFLAGAAGSFAQIGSIFSTDPLTPDLDKINPIKGLQRMFTIRTLLDGVRLILKMAAVTAVTYAIIKSEVFEAPQALSVEPAGQLSLYGHAATVMFFSLCGVLAFFSVFDFVLQKWEMGKQLRMTKQEAKQEFKEREGDPQIKARIRSVQREVARRRMMQAVKKADVIITNPTHIAVAIVYERGKMDAPKVVAKGADFLAQKIKKIAAEAGVPLVENVPLARTLYKTVKVGQGVPRALYQAVAEVLAYVYRLKGRTQ